MNTRAWLLVLAVSEPACKSKAQASAAPASPAPTRAASAMPSNTAARAGTGAPAASASATAAAPTCPEGMLKVPGGKFWMGSLPDEGFADAQKF